MEIESQIHVSDLLSVLNNERRRCVLDVVAKSETPVSLSQLADEVTRMQYSDSFDSSNRSSVYISLKQTHLEKMTEHDVLLESSQDYYEEGVCFHNLIVALDYLRSST